MQITGKITTVLQPEQGTSKRSGTQWMSQKYVIEEVGVRYPQSLVFKVFGQDKIQQFNIQVGQMLTVSFSVRAHRWKDKWYNDDPVAFSVAPVQQQPQYQQPYQQPQQPYQQQYGQQQQQAPFQGKPLPF